MSQKKKFQRLSYINETIFFGEITHHLDLKVKKMLANTVFGNMNSTFSSGP